MWSDVYVTANFTGTSCAVNLVDGQVTIPSCDIPGTGNYYSYSIDNAPFTAIPTTSATSYPIATGLAPGTHSLVFTRRTESKFGTTTFKGVTLDPGATLVAPGTPAMHKVEVFGDSITAGLANDDTGDWTNATENGYMAYGPQFARLVNAEWHVEARGAGAFYGDSLPMVPWFNQMFGPNLNQDYPDGGSESWDFTQWQPDVLILALGTNDVSTQCTSVPQQSYVGQWVSFLTSLRGWYPHAEIFCLAPLVDQQNGLASAAAPWDAVRQYIAEAVTQLGDPHTHSIIPLEGTAATGYSGQWIDHPADYVQCDDIHPNVGGHTKIATHLQSIIAPIMGW
jgi:lysophospholipase L1-like esterase